MSSLRRHPPLNAHRYSAKKMLKPIPFVCSEVDAQEVFIIGDFNDWDPRTHPMKRQHDGMWRIELPLCHGHHHYLFMVDGKPLLDPRANGVARNGRNEKVSLVAVS
jgi:1,4-alpha-glucan branching enzyme